MVNVSDGAKEKLLEYLKTNNSDLAVRVILSQRLRRSLAGIGSG